MGRINYVCTICSEHFTRRYNGERHNRKSHNGRSKIVRLIEYLAGRRSGKYEPDSPAWFSNKVNWRRPPHDAYQFSNTQVLRPAQVTQPLTYTASNDQQSYSERMLKIVELKSLLDKHSAYLRQDPQTILGGILTYSSSREDDSILDEKLDELRAFDRRREAVV